LDERLTRAPDVRTITNNVRLRLLGGLEVFGSADERASIQITTKKGLALLAYVAMHRQRKVSREQLATLLWDDGVDERARQNLRKTIERLRADLGARAADVLLLHDNWIGLRSESVTVDALEFAAMADDGLPDFGCANALYGGAFLGDFFLDIAAFDDWVVAERTRIEAIAARVFASCAERLDSLGDGQRAIDAAERLVAIDPLREDWQRQLLSLSAKYAGREAALSLTSRVVALLKRELDVDPDEQTTALVQKIRSGGFARAPRSATGLAAQPQPEDAPSPASDQSDDVSEQVTLETSDVVTIRYTTSQPARRAGRFGLYNRWGWLAAVLCAGILGLTISYGFRSAETSDSAGAKEGHIALPTDDPSWRPPQLTGAGADRNVLASKGVTPVAVLPFVVLAKAVGVTATDADLLTNDLTNYLSRIPSLRVISSRTTRLYKDRPIDVGTVGTELGVRYLIQGSVQLDGDALQVNVELVDARDRLVMWSDRLNIDRNDRLAMQDFIMRGLARSLHVEVFNAERWRIQRQPSKEQAGVDELLAIGWSAIINSTMADSLGEAEAAFEEALRRDPELVSAMIGLAAHHIIAVGTLIVPNQEPYLGIADGLLERVMQKNLSLSAAHFYRGSLRNLRGELEPAAESYAHALAINPSFAPAYGQIGRVLTRLGRIDEAVQHIQYALRLSPKDPNLAEWLVYLGWAECERQNDDEAIKWLRRALALNPRSRLAFGGLAAVYAMAGDSKNAAVYAAKLRELTPGFSDERRLEQFGGTLKLAAPHRLVDGVRLALAPP